MIWMLNDNISWNYFEMFDGNKDIFHWNNFYCYFIWMLPKENDVLCIFNLPIYTYLHVIFIPQKSCMLSWFCKFPQFCHVKFLTNKETVQRSNIPPHTTQPIPAACCSLLRAACCGLPCPGIIALHGWISCLLIFSTVVAAQGSERCCICTSFHL